MAQDHSLPRFSLAQLHYFSVCAEAMNMTRAAEILHVSQSTVSASMVNLESALGAQLFLRTRGRPLALTRAGHELLTHARSLLASANELAIAGHESGAELTGSLRVGVYQTLSPFYLPSLVSDFQYANPAVSLSFVEGDLSSLLAEVRDGGCEVALVYDWDLPPEMESIRFKEFRPYGLVHAEHPLALAGRREASLAELSKDPLVLLDLSGNFSYFQLLLDRVGEFTVGYRSSSYETVRSFVGAGLGFSILHQRPSDDRTYAGSSVYALDLTDALPTVAMSIVFRAGIKLTRKARSFIHTCRTVIAEGATCDQTTHS